MGLDLAASELPASEDPVAELAAQALDRLNFGSAEARAAYESLLLAYRSASRDVGETEAAADARPPEPAAGLQPLSPGADSLIQTERMASLGGLVASVAHEISTPVGITVTAASHLAEETEKMRRALAQGRIRKSDFDDFMNLVTEASQLILANSRRAAELINGFKQVAVDQTTSERRRFDLHDYVLEVLLSLRPRLRQTGHKVTVECPESVEIDGCPGALSQILTNLIMNAVLHGYPPGVAGSLSLAVRPLPGDWIELSFADDGQGIPEALRSRVFDPFFTTKKGAGGTGLGLYVVHSIVTKALHGTIALADCAGGHGACFIIRFPRILPPAGDG
jgi:signal transduction histidine kinase